MKRKSVRSLGGVGGLWPARWCSLLFGLLIRVTLTGLHPGAPTGTFGIGTATYAWTDVDREEILTIQPGGPRRLMAQVWYPTSRRRGSSAYVDDPDVPRAVERAQGLAPVLGFLRSLRSHARPGAAPVAGPLPVVVYLTGLTGYRQASMFQVEELVSHGYVVVGLDQPGMSATVRFPGGERVAGLAPAVAQPLINQSITAATQPPAINGVPMPHGIIPYLASDVRFALDKITDLDAADPQGQLTGLFDLDRIGIMGISLGGITGAEACRNEPRLKACLVLDAPMTDRVARDGLRQPAMWITRRADVMRAERAQTGGWSDEDIARQQQTVTSAYLASTRSWLVEIQGIFHVEFTDVPFGSPLIDLLLSGPLPGRRAHQIVNACTVEFFDQTLRERGSRLLAGDTSNLPEVSITSHASGSAASPQDAPGLDGAREHGNRG